MVPKNTVFSALFGQAKVQYPKAFDRQVKALVPGTKITVKADTTVLVEAEDGSATVEAKVLKKGDTFTITGELVHKHFMVFPVQAGDLKGYISKEAILAYEVKP
jgi:hypothetical protein